MTLDFKLSILSFTHRCIYITICKTQAWIPDQWKKYLSVCIWRNPKDVLNPQWSCLVGIIRLDDQEHQDEVHPSHCSRNHRIKALLNLYGKFWSAEHGTDFYLIPQRNWDFFSSKNSPVFFSEQFRTCTTAFQEGSKLFFRKRVALLLNKSLVVINILIIVFIFSSPLYLLFIIVTNLW